MCYFDIIQRPLSYNVVKKDRNPETAKEDTIPSPLISITIRQPQKVKHLKQYHLGSNLLKNSTSLSR